MQGPNWWDDEEPECHCDLHWERNGLFGEHIPDFQLMAWHCPLHGTVFPDPEGNPMPAEWVERHLARTKKERDAERQRRAEQARRGVERWRERREAVA